MTFPNRLQLGTKCSKTHTQMTVILEFAEIPHELYPVSEFFNDSNSVAFYMLAGLLWLNHLNSRAEFEIIVLSDTGTHTPLLD